MTNFDPYHEWLGISPAEQPPNHYRLLGIAIFESSDQVIVNAADRQMLFVRQFQTGEHQAESQRLLNEIAAAKVCLLNPVTKANYDDALQSEISPAPAEQMSGPNVESPSVADEFASHSFFSGEPAGFSSPSRHSTNTHRLRLPVRMLGHVLASIVGIVAALLILEWIRSGESEPLTAAPTPSSQVQKETKRTATKVDPFDLKTDKALPAPKTLPKRTDLSDSVAPPRPTPLHSKAEQVESLSQQRDEAILGGNLSNALYVTEQLAVLDGSNVLKAKLELLEQFGGKVDHTSFAEHCLLVMDDAIEKADKVVALRAAELALIASREAEKPTLIRRATQGILKVENTPADSRPSVVEEALPLPEDATEPQDKDSTSLKQSEGFVGLMNIPLADGIPPMFKRGESYQLIFRLASIVMPDGSEEKYRPTRHTIVYEHDGQCFMLSYGNSRWPCTVTQEEVRWSVDGRPNTIHLWRPETRALRDGKVATIRYLITPVMPVPEEYFVNQP